MKTYPLFDHWYKTTDWILDKCDRMPKHTRFTISGRIADATLEVLELITEAIYTKARRPILQHINLLLEKLRILFRLCFDRRYIGVAQYEYIQTELQTAGRMCGGWLQSLPGDTV